MQSRFSTWTSQAGSAEPSAFRRRLFGSDLASTSECVGGVRCNRRRFNGRGIEALDHDRRGRSILNVDRTDHPDAVLDVAELSIALADGSPAVSGALIASVRPAGGDKLDDVE